MAIKAPPVDPQLVADHKGIIVEEWSEFPAGCYGALILQDGRFKIAVSSACPTNGHRRFTIAHELGHYHLDGHVDGIVRDGRHLSFGSNFRTKKDRYEVEADAFASELLIPRRFAAGVVKGHRAGLGLVQAVASQFQTSLSCSGIRVAALTSEIMAVLISNKTTIEWVAGSGAMYDQEWFRKRSWKGEWAPRGSGTYRLATDQSRVRQMEEDGSTGVLCEWFDGAPAIPVAEEAMGLGTYGRVLTVLVCQGLEQDSEHPPEHESKRDWRDAMRTYRWDSYD